MGQEQTQSMELATMQELHQVSEKIGRVEDKVDRIENYLTGNVLDKDDKGMIGKVNVHEDRINKLEKKFDRFIYIIIGASAFGGYGVIELLTKIFTHASVK